MTVDLLDGVDELRAAWLDWRRDGIGASDVSAILGINPWASAYSVWAEKTGRISDEDATEAMELGSALEPTIANLFHRRTGLWVVGAQTWCEHPNELWARATLDGFAAESQWSTIAGSLGGYEAKSTSDSPRKWAEEIPPMYQAQIQFQMWVTGMERTWLGVLHASFGARFRWYGPIERDEEDIRLIADRCRTFWFDHVVADVAPDVDGHDATTEALKQILAEPGTTTELSPTAVDALAERDRLKALAADTKERLAVAENTIRAALDTATEGVVNGDTVVSWRPSQTTRADPDAMRAAGVFEEFSKTSTGRTLRRHKPKEEKR